MGEIYVKASLVLACIGPTHPFIESVRALHGEAIVQDLTRDEAYQIDRSTMRYEWYPDRYRETRFPITADDKAVVKRLIAEWHELSQRPYFKRAWIVQELTGGKGHTVILCGQDKLDWSVLMAIGGRLIALNRHLLTNMSILPFEHAIFALDTIVSEIGTGAHFTQYLDETCYFRCKDPRDRVFSMLTLVDWASHAQAPLLPDYSMTSFQLAFQLMSRLVELDFKHVSNIVIALSPGWQYSEDIHNEILAPYKIDNWSTARHKWTENVDAAYLIQQDPVGRFQVDLRGSKTEDAADYSSRWLPNHDYSDFAASGIVPVFADGGIIALACDSIRRGDILLLGGQFSLVLRACSDASTFVIVGAAYVLGGFSPPWSSDACECWQADAGEYDSQPVKICLDVTREEAFADQLVKKATQVDTSVDVDSYLNRHAIGTVRKGSCVRDVTAQGWRDDEIMGPSHPVCSAHLSGELHRALRNPLWFALLSGSNGFVRTCKPPRNRTASMSSSEWVTEEE